MIENDIYRYEEINNQYIILAKNNINVSNVIMDFIFLNEYIDCYSFKLKNKLSKISTYIKETGLGSEGDAKLVIEILESQYLYTKIKNRGINMNQFIIEKRNNGFYKVRYHLSKGTGTLTICFLLSLDIDKYCSIMEDKFNAIIDRTLDIPSIFYKNIEDAKNVIDWIESQLLMEKLV
ncbi:MAG: hypothetical protein ACOCP8_07830 [archaeon]